MAKRMLICMLACLMIGLWAPNVGAEAADTDAMVQLVSALGIMEGDGDGNFRLEDNVTRAEFTKVAIAASEYRNAVPAGLMVSPFADVSYTHWAAPYIKLASANGLVTGYVDSTFRPDADVTYAEAVTVVLRLLGYTDDDFGDSWPYGQVGLASGLGLSDGIYKTAGETMTRGDVLQLIYNLLDTKPKGATTEYISEFDCIVTENVILIATAAEDASVGSGKVYTSAGTYKIGDGFDSSDIGRTGDLVLINGDEVLYFRPDDQTITSYTVDTVLGADLVLDGKMPGFDENLTVYYKTEKTTYSNMASVANEGARFVTYADSNGVLDYAFLLENDGESVDVTDLERYVVYTHLGNAILAYSDGALIELPVTDSTPAYQDSQRSTYSAVKDSLVMGDIVYVKRDGKGDIDYISVEEGSVEGPITVTDSNWYASFGDITNMTILRDGQKVAADALQVNDIAYYSADLGMILAYSKKVTGIYTGASPNKDLPESVTVSGTEYAIEGIEAYSKLCSGGTFAFGDTVTLLLGRDGGVADVISPGSSGSSEVVYGYLTDAGKKTFTDAYGEPYSAYYVTVVQPDGSSYEYIAKTDYSTHLSRVVKVAFTDGVAQVTWQNQTKALSGLVDAAGRSIGSTAVADTIQILDVGTQDSTETPIYATTYLQRLDGVTLSSDSVLFYTQNSEGEVDTLFLNNVTGDAFSYGLVTAASSRSSDMSASGSYTIDVGGTVQSISTNAAYSVYRGNAVQLSIQGGQVDTLLALTELSEKVTNLTETYLETSEDTYLLSDSVAVYERTADYKYLYTPLSEIIGTLDTGRLTAYYDKPQSRGGRIRILVYTES